ncbi:hypothetical protein FRC16_004427 [Serendipita sp. 398]|nr:hypothetical protein FRC16_004427 [Serendipita sp. 398]
MQDQAASINKAIQNLNGAATQSATNTQCTYSEALRQATSPPANNATANNVKISNRLNIQATQILIEFDPTSKVNNLNHNQASDATSKMRTKAIKALKKVTKGSDIKASIKHATITWRGGLLIELNLTDAAAWLCKEANTKRFTDTLAAGSKLRKRTYPVILKFIPVRWTPEQPESLCKLEERLDLTKGSLIKAKWIKDPARPQLSEQDPNL